MKTSVVLAVSIVMVSILFCPMVMARPSSTPSDLQIVQPDPSLPKELSAFFGKWEGSVSGTYTFLIVEKIDEENASLYIFRESSFPEGGAKGWHREKGHVIKEGGKYKIWYRASGGGTVTGTVFLTLQGEYLDSSAGPRLIRVP